MKPDPTSNPLVVRRPGDELTEPEIMSAWQAIQRNPSAMAAAHAELQQDEDLRTLLREAITPPADLFDRLQEIKLPPLSATAPTNIVPFHRRAMIRWGAAAAAVVAAAYFWQTSNSNSKIVWEHWKLQALKWANGPQLAMQSESLEQLKHHLQGMGAVPPNDIPGKLTALPTIGCQMMQVDSGKVAVICFNRNGKAYHLFAGDEDAVVGGINYLAQGKPTFWSETGWQAASWRNERQAYMLLTQAPETELREIFT